jgi:RHS repeat-associated protein
LDAYGNLLSEKGDSPNPFRLRGQYQDAETGLYYNFNRHYDPALGDYTAPDPIGLAGGYHFYAYPRNPLRWDDPFGLECPDDDPDKDKNHPPDDDPDKPKEGGPPPVGDPPESPAPGTPAPGGPGSGPHSSGTEDPPLTGADPNSVYTRTSGDGSVAVQNTVYDENGNAVAHVDFKPHGPDAPSGHAHDFPPGGPVGGGHGPGAEHTPPADVPPDWSRTGGVPPAYPIGATQK